MPGRVVIEAVSPAVDDGRYPVKRVPGETVDVEADVFTDGHDMVAAAVRFRRAGERSWSEAPMEPLGNDRWCGSFVVTELGSCEFTVAGWVDRFGTWQRDLRKRVEAGLDVAVELLVGAELVRAAADRARGAGRKALAAWAERLGAEDPDPDAGLSEDLAVLMAGCPDRSSETVADRVYPVLVDDARARFSSWYEFFPRSCGPPGRHGTLADAEGRLPDVAAMGFDTVYLPPIHPIGVTGRKGRNNTPHAEEGDTGSPWAIGGEDGGHTAIHPELGTLDDFDRFVERARGLGLEVAIDLAFQASPDHPYVKEHPEWFRHRPDGTIRYAENPPKRYEDIYPLDFEGPAWRELWEELRGVVEFWLARGVRTFRVDNPHTKPFAFWEWLIAEIRAREPSVVFLSEAFTRPAVMYRLAKIGFDQSYTYFTWRNSARELREYLTELTRTTVAEFFRPNLWPNTPDILSEHLQIGGRPAFMARLVLAATLGASYGIYGPPFELTVNQAREPGSEEYLDSEKYQLRHWDLDAPWSLVPLITRVNAIRRAHPALHADRSLRFHDTANDALLAYTKRSPDGSDLVLVVVNTDPFHHQAGLVDLPLDDLGIDPDQAFQVHDLLTDARYLWQGYRNYVGLDPSSVPAHIFTLRRRLRTEHDFDYFA